MRDAFRPCNYHRWPKHSGHDLKQIIGHRAQATAAPWAGSVRSTALLSACPKLSGRQRPVRHGGSEPETQTWRLQRARQTTAVPREGRHRLDHGASRLRAQKTRVGDIAQRRVASSKVLGSWARRTCSQPMTQTTA